MAQFETKSERMENRMITRPLSTVAKRFEGALEELAERLCMSEERSEWLAGELGEYKRLFG